MKSLIQKSFIPTGLVLASLALSGHAMAATAHVKARTPPQAASRAGVDVAAIPPYPNYTDTRWDRTRKGTAGTMPLRGLPIGIQPADILVPNRASTSDN
jgi:hypothetical protein